MRKTAIIYKSVYGYTKKYAEWISEDLQAALFELKEFDINRFSDYDTLIFGAGLYAGNIAVKNIIKKNFEKIKDKKIILFTVGLADVANEENTENIKKRILSEFGEEIFGKIKIFNLRAGIDYGKLSFIHKQMMNMVKMMASKKSKEEFSAEEREFLETFGKTVDFSDKNSILTLVEFVKEN